LKENKAALKRFAGILLPTLTDAYTSTVNLNVRQKVLTAQLKMISNMETDILKEALSGLQFASHLATILSQQDHPSLVYSGIDAAELLLRRLPDVYRYHFYREGVIYEIQKLASKLPDPVPVSLEEEPSDDSENEEDHMGSSPVSSRSSSSSRREASNVSDLIVAMDSSLTLQAKRFMEFHEKDKAAVMKAKAEDIMGSLTSLADGLKTENQPAGLFKQLAGFFSADSLKSISSFELLNSGIVEALLSVLESTVGKFFSFPIRHLLAANASKMKTRTKLAERS
jgi:E3 ubiquitin-protein ligase TRIP12